MTETIQAFTPEQVEKAHHLLASAVAAMQGRKFEEEDWSSVYRLAKDIPHSTWSNLHIDVMHNGLGVEHKMLCLPQKKGIREYCGTSQMHPSATRSIRVGDLNREPDEVMRDVFEQYGELIKSRTQLVGDASSHDVAPDMRVGWLLWQNDLEEFMYFEEPMRAPDPSAHYAIWDIKAARGARKGTKNLWVYDKKTKQKRYSITTEAGAKIQPYFDIPAPNDPNLYYFRVQGEVLPSGSVRVWITPSTAICLTVAIGSLDSVKVEEEIMKAPAIDTSSTEYEATTLNNLAKPLLLSKPAYHSLRSKYKGVSDDHCVLQFAEYLISKKSR